MTASEAIEEEAGTLFGELLEEFNTYCHNQGDPTETIPFPLPMLAFYDEKRRVATIGLREHDDERGYRQALVECLSIVPYLNTNTSVLYFKLENEGRGMLVAGREKVIRGALVTKDKLDTNIDVSVLDIPTVDALKKATDTDDRMDVEYAFPLLDTLRRRGHQVFLDSEPAPILAGMERL